VSLTICVLYDSSVVDNPQAGALKEAAGERREVDGRHTGADDLPADAAAGLVQLSGLVQRLYASISQRHDLTPLQAKLLCIVAEGPRGMAELAHCLGVEKAALTGLVDRVERRGLANRTPVHGDRRALQVTLTDTGRRAASAFHDEVTIELEHLLLALAPHDREQFHTAMAAIIAQCPTQTLRNPTGATSSR
jgi:DNA-binding MarR family transcriptional regulator